MAELNALIERRNLHLGVGADKKSKKEVSDDPTCPDPSKSRFLSMTARNPKKRKNK